MQEAQKDGQLARVPFNCTYQFENFIPLEVCRLLLLNLWERHAVRRGQPIEFERSMNKGKGVFHRLWTDFGGFFVNSPLYFLLCQTG